MSAKISRVITVILIVAVIVLACGGVGLVLRNYFKNNSDTDKPSDGDLEIVITLDKDGIIF